MNKKKSRATYKCLFTFFCFYLPLLQADVSEPTVILSTLPDGFEQGRLITVAMNPSGQSLLVGTGETGSLSALLIYRLENFSSTPTHISTSGFENTDSIENPWCAIDPSGNGLILGEQVIDEAPSPFFYRLQANSSNLTLVPSSIPPDYTFNSFNGVAFDSSGNALAIGNLFNPRSTLIPFIYKLAEGVSTPTYIEPELPDGLSTPVFSSLAMNSSGKTIIIGTATDSDSEPVPLVYRLDSFSSSPIYIPTPLPSESLSATMSSVAIDSSGNAVIVGSAYINDENVPIAYTLNNEDSSSTLIIPSIPEGFARGELVNVAINSSGDSIMGGYVRNSESIPFPLTYTLTEGSSTPTLIFPSIPDDFNYGSIGDVSIASSGTALLLGVTVIDNTYPIPLIYSLESGSTSPTILLSTPPTGFSYSLLYDAAINSSGSSIMVGYATSGETFVPLVYTISGIDQSSSPRAFNRKPFYR